MFINNIFSKTWLRAQYSIVKYAIRLRRKTDDEIISIVNHERGLRAWCSERSYFLAALRHECKRRRLQYIQ